MKTILLPIAAAALLALDVSGAYAKTLTCETPFAPKQGAQQRVVITDSPTGATLSADIWSTSCVPGSLDADGVDQCNHRIEAAKLKCFWSLANPQVGQCDAAGDIEALLLQAPSVNVLLLDNRTLSFSHGWSQATRYRVIINAPTHQTMGQSRIFELYFPKKNCVLH